MDVPPVPPAVPPPSSTSSAGAGAAGLQFDTADFGPGAAALTCAACKRPIAGEYYDVNGQTFCPTCTAAVEHMFGDTAGSPEILRALVFGLGGGVAGALIAYGVMVISGMYIGLLAVGWLVGHAVRRATSGRGRALHRGLAVGITYLAVATSFVPFVDGGSPLETAFMAVAAPFLLLRDGRLTIVIVALGLYEAWRLNTPVRLTVTGPLHAGFGRPATLPGRTPSDVRSA